VPWVSQLKVDESQAQIYKQASVVTNVPTPLSRPNGFWFGVSLAAVRSACLTAAAWISRRIGIFFYTRIQTTWYFASKFICPLQVWKPSITMCRCYLLGFQTCDRCTKMWTTCRRLLRRSASNERQTDQLPVANATCYRCTKPRNPSTHEHFHHILSSWPISKLRTNVCRSRPFIRSWFSCPCLRTNYVTMQMQCGGARFDLSADELNGRRVAAGYCTRRLTAARGRRTQIAFMKLS